MGIDRPDEDDEPTVDPDSATGGRDAPTLDGDSPYVEHDASADSDADRVAYTLKYRADVAAAYEAAWDEAMPEFDAAWQEHARRFSEPERSGATVQDDGSWHGDGVLELNPEQNASVDRQCERIREAGETVIIPAMRRIEAEDPVRHLVGYDKHFKEPDRFKEKVAEELRPPSKLTVEQAIDTVPDGARFTLCYRESGYAGGVRTDVERLKDEGFELVKLKNTWSNEQYKGINSQWRERQSDVRFEVQFHTQVSFEARELSHKAYERLRGPAARDDEREELEAFQAAVYSMVPIPQDATDIEDYPQKRRNG